MASIFCTYSCYGIKSLCCNILNTSLLMKLNNLDKYGTFNVFDTQE